MKSKEELIGQLFINESKTGLKYLRGHVNGVKVVAFLSKDGASYHVLADTREEDGKGSKAAPKKFAAKPKFVPKKPAKADDDCDAPF